MTTYISAGSNIGDRMKNLSEACSALEQAADIKIIKRASVYETLPVDCSYNINFYNTVLMIETTFSPHELLAFMQGIETALGRKREYKNAPRIIDLDLLLYEDFEIKTEILTVPHPRMYERAFVLAPLSEITGEKYTYDENNIINIFDWKRV